MIGHVGLGDYVDTYYGYNFNRPSNLTTSFRGFDNHTNSFTVENAVLDVTGTAGRTARGIDQISATTNFEAAHHQRAARTDGLSFGMSRHSDHTRATPAASFTIAV